MVLKSYVQCELSTLQSKIHHFIEISNKTISNFEAKPYETLQYNAEFLQNELRSKDGVIKTLMETQTSVLENLPLGKPPQQTKSITSFHDFPQKNFNQLNQKTKSSSKDKTNRYNNQSQH